VTLPFQAGDDFVELGSLAFRHRIEVTPKLTPCLLT
jgi:hypothetical protein